MFLKRIELSGFKSFADKTEMEFVTGITAVVGPNGSGKSNISDGIRWVLGEQSAKSLRGGKMEDIIFAGSDARKAVNYGEVSLTLDNGDGALPLEYNEVTVTRRVHRSGDSEYMINKQSCRLKDITELFMDTGIGKEAYSIIGQGRIEEILSTRSEDRRGIFEEASGIVKYKSRKREAQRKLEDTENNLLRIHDLVTELEDQVEPLRIQSEKAIHFKQLREQLKTQEISMYVHNIENVYGSWSESNAKLERLKREQLELSTVVSKHDAHLEKDRQALRELEEALDRLHADMLHYSEEYEKCEGYGEVLKERKKNLEQNKKQLEETISAQDERIAALTSEEAEFRNRAAVLELQLAELKHKLAVEEDNLIGVSGGTAVDAEEMLKGELLEVLSTMAQLRNEIRYAAQQQEAVQRRMERLSDEEAKWAEQQRKLNARRAELEKQLEATLDAIGKARTKYIDQAEKAKELGQISEDATTALRKWEQKLDAQVSRRDTMKEMQDALDGFMHGVREVLKASRRSSGSGGISGVHGAVAELVRVPERIETAVETALGGALQHIVMEDEKSARSAISFLKQRQLGRATFLPLDVIRGRHVPEHEKRMAESVDGFVGVAADLVSCEPRYEAIIQNLLGNVLLAETLEQANRIASKCQYRYRVVTLEGDVVNAGGSMTGGSLQKKGASLLGRQRQIEALDQEIMEGEKTIVQLRDKLSDIRKEQSILSQNMEELRSQAEQYRIDEQQVRAELQQLSNEAKHLTEQEQLFTADRTNHTAEQKSMLDMAAEAEVRLEQLTADEARLQEAIRLAEERRKASESAKEELQVQLTDLKISVAKTDQEKQSFEDQAARVRADIQRAKQELASSRNLLSQQDAEIERHSGETVAQIEQLNHLRLKKQECAEQTDLKRSARADRVKELEQGESDTKEQRGQLRQVEEQMRQTEIAANRLDVELDNLLRKLSEEYELSFELAKEQYPVPEDIVGTQNAVRDIKRQITALGDVNLGAIEEYERVRERFEFLTEQKDDLVEAKTTLYQVIREMDEEMSKRFRSTFEQIRRHFVVVFAKLFGGGRADLVLVDPERVLDTGIDIVAQPPGKKLQNLQLLSGGERALTAIALLFAILQVKPVPFCVLDEVEAALDEANVARFAQYLREFSGLTQFIVVTHRKGTMEEADVLYGVTMEEGGVSKLVSVRLEEEAEEQESA
ncbi:chromosome segregation protein SMC [Paenibacillus sp. ATY16]|uniref:chromosome segregation protein SMC n=1 Tax=Paenibacillus sp. ATY16 TaxID=1759312 RepID=UPI00200BBB02|nr:chromosome segregation protein SMC [Paenibacillus sp. ATY16]MCK9860582.1 chromosome segregation protein SMC [Paenibacillus sp. ATY16]